MNVFGNQKNRKPHRTGGRSSTHDAHTAADGFGKGKVKCPTCQGKKKVKVYPSQFGSKFNWIPCTNYRCDNGWVRN